MTEQHTQRLSIILRPLCTYHIHIQTQERERHLRKERRVGLGTAWRCDVSGQRKCGQLHSTEEKRASHLGRLHIWWNTQYPWKKDRKRPFSGQGTTNWGPCLTGRGWNPGRKGPPALGTGPALYLASIVQGGRTLGGGGLPVKGKEQILSPKQLPLFNHTQP